MPRGVAGVCIRAPQSSVSRVPGVCGSLGSGGSHRLPVGGICPQNRAQGASGVLASSFALGSILATPERRLSREVEQLTCGH